MRINMVNPTLRVALLAFFLNGSHIVYGGEVGKLSVNHDDSENIQGDSEFHCESVPDIGFYNSLVNGEPLSCGTTTNAKALPETLAIAHQKCTHQRDDFVADLVDATYNINVLEKNVYLYIHEYQSHLFVFTARHATCAIVPTDLVKTIDVRLSAGNDVLYAPFVTKDMNIFGIDAGDEITLGLGNNKVFERDSTFTGMTSEPQGEERVESEEMVTSVSFRKRRVL